MKNPCLVLIDMQEKLFPAISNNEILLDNIEILIRGFQLFDFPIVVTEQVPDKLGKTIDRVTTLFKQVKPIIKSSFSCLGEPNFIKFLETHNPSEIILAGLETHVCVYQTALDLIKENKHVEVVANGVSSRDVDNHLVALSRMQNQGVLLNTVEMLFFNIQKKAEGDTFKKLIKLLK